MNFFKHLCKILIHKFWVMYYCCKYGIIWQGIIHDISKFSFTEFLQSYKYYVGTSSPINEAFKDKGYSEAWIHHFHKNPHHFEYWVYITDNKVIPLKMPNKYVLELCCDWLGAGRAYMGKSFTIEKEKDFVTNKLNKVSSLIHPDTKQQIQEFFNKL